MLSHPSPRDFRHGAVWKRLLIALVVAVLAFPLTPFAPASSAIAAPGDPAVLYLGPSTEAGVVGSYKSATGLRECPNNQVLTGVRVQNRTADAPSSANSIVVQFDIRCASVTIDAAGQPVLAQQPWQTYTNYNQGRGNVQEGMCPTGSVAHRMTGTTFVGQGGARWPSQVRLECRTLGFSAEGRLGVNLAAAATTVTAGQNFNNNSLNTPAFRCGSAATTGWGNSLVRGYRPQLGGEGIDGYNPSCSTIPRDFGDAPQSYGSASHELNAATYLGSAVDPEAAQQYSANAKADDTPGGTAPNLAINDEEGLVAAFEPLVAGITDTYSTSVYVANKVPGQNATLIGWIDFNKNGVFDAAEATSATIAAGTPDGSTQTLTWNGVAAQTSSASGQTFARFRISTDAQLTAAAPTGALANGEVEDHALVITTFEPGLSVVKSSDKQEVTAAGEVITYSFRVTNTGNVPIDGVVPVETSFTGTGSLGAFTPATADLASGAVETFTAQYTVTQADIDAGGVTNAASATGTPPEGSELTPPTPSQVTVPAPRSPGLSIVKTADPSDPAAFTVGQEITYSFLMTNTGNTTLTEVAPVEGTFTGSGTLGAITPGPVTLAPGASQTFTAGYTLTQADVDSGKVENSATGTGVPPTGPPVETPPSEFEVPVVPNPALTVVKTSDKSEIAVAGEVITYSFLVTNTGNVTMTDVVPVEGDFSGSGSISAFSPESATLAPGASQTFTATYTVTQADIDAGGVTNAASVTGTPPGEGEFTPPPPSEVVVPATPEPGLSIVKTADPSDPAAFTVGQEITYSFLMRNTGNTTLTEVAPVEGTFTGSGTLGAITPGPVTLAPGASQTFTAGYTLTQADVDSGKVENSATGTGVPPTGPPVETPPSEFEVPVVPNPALTVVKTSDKSEIAVAGEVITYSFLVTNTGNVTMTDVVPVETAFSGTGTLGTLVPTSATLVPGESATFTAEYTVTQADIDAGGVTNAASVTGTPPGDGEFTPPPPSEVVVPATPVPALTVVKTSDKSEIAAAGEVITYSFLVTNTGNVTMTDVVPVETTFTGTGTVGGFSPASATLAPGASQTFTAEYTVTQADIDAGGVTNAASVTGTPPGDGELTPPPPSEVVVPATPEPGLTVVKTADLIDPVNYRVGQVVTYLFRVTNTGNVTLEDVAPTERTFSGTGVLGDLTPDTVTLAPGETAMFSAPYTLTQADLDAGSVTNAATATGVPPTGPPINTPPSDVEIPTPADPALTVVKTSDKTEIAAAGEVITYSFLVTNTGNVTMTDVVPVETTFTGTGTVGGFTPASATLAPGASETFTATYTVTQADIDAGGVTNAASATGTPPGEGELTPPPPSEVVVPATPEPGLTVVKTSDKSEIAAAGEVITYSFLVTNTGNVTMTDVVPVEGDFSGSGSIGAFSPESATLAPGASETFTATYTVTQADIDAGGVTNAASVTGTPPGEGEFTPPPPSEVVVPATPEPGLTVVKTSDKSEIAAAGEVITYSFLVTNTGNVTMTDVVPVEGDFSGSGSIGAFSPESATLAPGASETFTATYTVTQADIDAGGVTNAASVTGTPPGEGEFTPPPPSEVVVPATPNPALSIVKSADVIAAERFEVGRVITYTFVATNTGNVTLTDVAVAEGEFTGSGDLGAITPASVDVLAPGAQATFSAQYTLTQADVDAGSVENTATAQGVPPTGPPIESPPSKIVVPTPAEPGLSIVKSSDVDTVSAAGDVVTYSFIVTNTGNVTVTDVVPVEGTFTGSGKLGTIAPEAATLLPGQSATFTAEYTVTQADVDAGGVTNTATATGTPPGGSTLPPTPPSEVTVSVPATPSLALVKTADVDQVRELGQVVTYTFVVTNTGNVTMTDVAPVEGTFSGVGTLSGLTPTSVASLAPGEEASFTAQYRVMRADLSGKALTNTATAVGTPPGGDVIVSPPSTADVPTVQLVTPPLPMTGSPYAWGMVALLALLLAAGGVILVRREVMQK